MGGSAYIVRFNGRLSRDAIAVLSASGLHVRSAGTGSPAFGADGGPLGSEHEAEVVASSSDAAVAAVRVAVEPFGRFSYFHTDRTTGAGNRNPGWSYLIHALLQARDIDGLIEQFGRSFWDEAHAREALAQLGEDAVPSLIDGLSHEDTRVRARCAMTLGDIRDPRASKPLFALLTAVEPSEVEGPQYEAWASAAYALGALEHRPAVPVLERALSVEDIDIRQDAAAALGEMGDKSAIGSLIAVLEEGRIPESWSARDALLMLGGPEAEAAVARYDAREANG